MKIGACKQINIDIDPRIFAYADEDIIESALVHYIFGSLKEKAVLDSHVGLRYRGEPIPLFDPRKIVGYIDSINSDMKSFSVIIPDHKAHLIDDHFFDDKQITFNLLKLNDDKHALRIGYAFLRQVINYETK